MTDGRGAPANLLSSAYIRRFASSIDATSVGCLIKLLLLLLGLAKLPRVVFNLCNASLPPLSESLMSDALSPGGAALDSLIWLD